MKPEQRKYSNYFLVGLSFFISLLFAEIALRWILSDQLYIPESERTLTYRYDEKLGWFPRENSTATFNLTTTINIKHNSRGFRDPEHEPDKRPGVLFLGDSFTWGYDVQAEERFTDLLRDSLPDLNLFNLGVSGYGNDQQLLLLREHLDFYKPELVVLVYCADNDRLDNSMNLRYANYYKPYFEISGDELTLEGQPVPVSAIQWFGEHPLLSRLYLVRLGVNAWFQNKNPEKILLDDPTHTLIKEIADFSKKHEAEFLVGMQKMDLPLMSFMESNEIEYVDLSNDYVFPFSGRHWTPEGHRYVASLLKPFLQKLDD